MTVEEESDQAPDNQETEKIQLEQTLRQMSASDELDRSFIIIDPHLWIAHLTILALALVVLLWAFFGSISIKIEGKGIVVDKEGLLNIEAKVTGIVQTLRVKEGSLVKQGDVLLQVIDPEQELKLKLADVRIAALKSDLELLKNEIASERSKQKEAILLEEELLKAQQEKDLLQLTKSFADVLSPFDGYVVEVLVNQGGRVTAGTSLIILENRKNLETRPPLIVYGFVSVDLGKRIRVGLPVQIEISTFSTEEYGKMLGTVTAVSEFAASPEHLAKLIHNQTLVNYLMGNNKAVIQLEITPERDFSTASGYKWTTKKGAPIPISSGTVCTIDAIVEQVKPFYFILPIEEFRNIFYFHNSDQERTEKQSLYG